MAKRQIHSVDELVTEQEPQFGQVQKLIKSNEDPEIQKVRQEKLKALEAARLQIESNSGRVL